MALPTLEKTWQFNVNNVVTAGATAYESYQKAMYKVKEILTTFPVSPWQVVNSSNSVVAGNADHWASPADVVFDNAPGNPFSYVSLYQPGLMSGGQIVLYCATANPASIYVLASVTGFTMPTTTGLTGIPADYFVVSGSTWLGNEAAPFQTVIHAMQSTDGKSTRVIMCINGINQGVMIFDEITDPVTGMTQPWYCYAAGSTSGVLTESSLTGAAGRGRDGSTNVQYALSTEGNGSFIIGTGFGTTNDISGEYFMAPVGVVSYTVGKTGRHGRLKDLWSGNVNAAITEGSTYPSGVSRQFAQFQRWIFPWDGSVPVIS